MRKVYLHIGIHKTGTTSLQAYLSENRDWLESNGKLYPNLTNQFGSQTHFGFNVFALDPGRDSPAVIRLGRREGFSKERYDARFAACIEKVLADFPGDIIFSNEGLSYVRSASEIERLKALFRGQELQVVVCFRDKVSYLGSYRREVIDGGFEESRDRSSVFYLQDDSWLTDYDALVDVYADGFGPENVNVIDYENSVARDGTVLPTLLEALGIDCNAAPKSSGYWLNRR